MKFKFFTVMFSVLTLGALNIFSQNPAPVLRDNSAEFETFYKIGEVRGSIKRKAAYLPKPSYPRQALEAGADGAVRVEVVIDNEGVVVAAKAVSGHPLLHVVAEETARKTKFRSLEIPDPNLRETGFITYEFAIEKYGWLKIGYDLAIIQKTRALEPFNVPRIVKAFLPEWTGEFELLGKLADLRSAENASQSGTFSPVRPTLVRKSQPVTRGALESSIQTEIRLPAPAAPTVEQIALAQNLIAALESRLGNDPPNLWRFKTGIDLVKAGETFRNFDDQSGVQILRQALGSAPPETPAETLTALKRLIEIFEGGRRAFETPYETAQVLRILFRSK
jgi:TonB family protein